MDMQLSGLEGSPTVMPTVDLYVVPGLPGTQYVPILSGDAEKAQQAQACIGIPKGFIPQLPDVGPDWLGFISGTVDFGDLVSQVLKGLSDGGHSDFFPNFDIVDDVLTVNAEEQGATK